jgi:hypothetical protein
MFFSKKVHLVKSDRDSAQLLSGATFVRGLADGKLNWSW